VVGQKIKNLMDKNTLWFKGEKEFKIIIWSVVSEKNVFNFIADIEIKLNLLWDLAFQSSKLGAVYFLP